MRRKELIINPYFIIGLIILVLNDWVFKYQFHNTLTGKLSDFVGLLIFPMFLAFVFKSFRNYSTLIVGILFIIWKTPLVTLLIDFINLNGIVEFGRVIDYTDYIALTVLPFSHYLIVNKYSILKSRIDSIVNKSFRIVVLLFAFIAFTATSVHTRWFSNTVDFHINKEYVIKMPKDSVLSKIKNLGYDYTQTNDSSLYPTIESFYRIENVVIPNSSYCSDTIRKLDFTLEVKNENKTKISFYKATLDMKTFPVGLNKGKRIRREYKKLLKEFFIKEID